MDKAHHLSGRLDIVVNNEAYQQEQESILDITPEQLDGTLRANIYGYIDMVQAALPLSVTALKGNETLIDYSAPKGAIHTQEKNRGTRQGHVLGSPCAAGGDRSVVRVPRIADARYYTGETFAPTGSETSR